jgi:drug/metabolite transporter (DMT)-like permease
MTDVTVERDSAGTAGGPAVAEPLGGTHGLAAAFAEPKTTLAVVLTVVSWASAFVGIRLGVQAYAPEHVALLRYLVASLALLGYALAVRMPLPDRRDVPGLALAGLLGIAFYNWALSYGEVTITSATASFLIASAPVWMALIARVLLGERLRPAGWLGISSSFAGVAVIALGMPGGLRFDVRALAVLAAAIAQAFYSLGQKPLLTRYSALQCTAYAIWAGTICLLPLGAGLLAELSRAPAIATGAVIYMGVVPGALGYLAWSYVLSRLPSSIAGSYLYFVPPVAAAIAWLVLGEVPSVISVVGGLLVIGGVVLVNVRGRH